ncbi:MULTISPECIES: class C sortase [unclassified Bifidobacterium]|uniref:class C sortase n=1 Tax=unclassified Bifidobacterium TaxID=2608897 RepID=UPI0015E46E18|nr:MULTISPECIES: class C sortase [unclassified Bifidobacterium]
MRDVATVRRCEGGVCAVIDRRERRGRRLLLRGVAYLLVALLLIVGVFGARMVRQAGHERRAAEVAQAARYRSARERERMLDAARRYNDVLATRGQPVLGEWSTVPSDSAGTRDDGERSRYSRLLDISAGVMGSIRIGVIHVDLPIGHGTGEQTLARGAGHLYGTSLPVGGPSTHAVITAHSGLVRDVMFTHLDEVAVGDRFSIDVLGRSMDYRVDRISVIEPDDVTQRGCLIVCVWGCRVKGYYDGDLA